MDNNLNQSHSGTGDNVAGDKITNNIQINNDHLIRRTQEAYSKIYFWHKKQGRKVFAEFYEDQYEESFIGEYLDLVDTLPAPEIAELDEMVSICREFYDGSLSWSSAEGVQPINKRYRLIEFANEVLGLEKKFTARMLLETDLEGNQSDYYDAAKKILLSTDRELRKVRDEFNKENLGGLNVVIEASKEFDSPIVLTPELLGYKKVEENNSLVYHVRNRRIRLDRITLNTYQEDEGEIHRRSNYYVNIELTNLTNRPIEAYIPEGQIFENKEFEYEVTPTQNLATVRSKTVKVGANETITVQIPAYCMNNLYDNPDGGVGNLTIYEMLKKGFDDNGELWSWVRSNYDSIIERFK